MFTVALGHAKTLTQFVPRINKPGLQTDHLPLFPIHVHDMLFATIKGHLHGVVLNFIGTDKFRMLASSILRRIAVV
jgi:hypothetical protein